MDGERWFNADQARSQLDDFAYARLAANALHHPADVSVQLGEQEDGHRSPGTGSIRLSHHNYEIVFICNRQSLFKYNPLYRYYAVVLRFSCASDSAGFSR